MQAIPQKLSYMVLAAAAIFLLAQISETVRGCHLSALLSRRTVVVHSNLEGYSLKARSQIVQLFCILKCDLTEQVWNIFY
jgi:hypothetical protein